MTDLRIVMASMVRDLYQLLRRSVTSLGNYSDGVLILIGVLYLLGYASWSLYAFVNGLGPLPALDIQYFAAGIVPAVVVMFLVILVQGILRFRAKLPKLLNPIIPWQAKARWFMAGALLLSLVLFSFSGGDELYDKVGRDYSEGGLGGVIQGIEFNILTVSFITSVILFYLILPLPVGVTKPQTEEMSNNLLSRIVNILDRFLNYVENSRLEFLTRPLSVLLIVLYIPIFVVYHVITGIIRPSPDAIENVYNKMGVPAFRFVGTTYLIFFAVVISVLVISLFIEDIYPKIPQEFGGALPRCARIDIEGLSDETLVELNQPLSSETGSLTVRLPEVAVMYSGSDFVVIRREGNGPGSAPMTYQISADAIRAIVWC